MAETTTNNGHVLVVDDEVIFLTARDSSHDKVEGLRLGSDDYVTT